MRTWAWVAAAVLAGCAHSGRAAEPAKDAPKTLTAAQMEPRAASVVFVSGMKVEKCWYEERATGAWINYDGQRFWYTKDSIHSVAFLTGEPDDDLKDWLRKAEEARKKEEERAAKADEDREKKAQEAATPPMPPAGASGPSSAPSNPSAPGAQKPPEKRGGEVASVNQGKGGAGDNDGGNGGRRAGYGGTATVAGSGTGIGGLGINGVGIANAHLGVQWRVKDVDRKAGTVRLRNRLFHQYVTLKVKEPDDLKHVKVGQILEGALSTQQPSLTAPDGTAIEFDVTGLLPTP